MTFSTATILKILLVEFAKSPLHTLAEVGQRFMPQKAAPPQVALLREITRKTPLILQIETTNACNANCVFCAYPKLQRKKGVMSLPLFEQLVDEYAAMGGGPVSLTPLVGDALLDPHLLKRLRLLHTCPQISQISLTTNAIAFERYNDAEIQQILTAIDCIQISVGGLDAGTYRTLYGVDRFQQVQRELDRLLTLKDEVSEPPKINLAFRTNDWRFELRYRKQLEQYRRRGVFVSHIWNYANYAGLVQNDKSLKMEVIDGSMEKRQTCIYAAMHMAIGWDGRITACGCADFEGRELRIGQVGEKTLGEVWSGSRRKKILDSFAVGNLPSICRNCSAYQQDSAIFSKPFCRNIRPHQPLPAGFFQLFWGG